LTSQQHLTFQQWVINCVSGTFFSTKNDSQVGPGLISQTIKKRHYTTLESQKSSSLSSTWMFIPSGVARAVGSLFTGYCFC
jgi:hypothetical protein